MLFSEKSSNGGFLFITNKCFAFFLVYCLSFSSSVIVAVVDSDFVFLVADHQLD